MAPLRGWQRPKERGPPPNYRVHLRVDVRGNQRQRQAQTGVEGQRLLDGEVREERAVLRHERSELLELRHVPGGPVYPNRSATAGDAERYRKASRQEFSSVVFPDPCEEGSTGREGRT